MTAWVLFAPFDRLPSEILSMIIHLLLDAADGEDVRVGNIGVLRSVSSYWKAAVDGDPSLWTTIKSTFPSSGVDFVLSRCGNTPLNVVHSSSEQSLTEDQAPSPSTTQPAANTFFEQVSHTSTLWKRLHLDMPSETDHDKLVDYLSLPAPKLEELYITSPIRPHIAKLFPSSPPSLQRISVERCDIPLVTLPLHQLRELLLTDVAVTIEQTLQILSHTPRLRLLGISYWVYPPPPPPSSTHPSCSPLPVIHLSDLEEIELNCNRPFTDDLFLHITTPPLRRLAVYRDQDDTLSILRFAVWATETIQNWTGRTFQFGNRFTARYFSGPFDFLGGRWIDHQGEPYATNDQLAQALPRETRDNVTTVVWKYASPTFHVAFSISTLCQNVTSVYLPTSGAEIWDSIADDPSFFPQLRYIQGPSPYAVWDDESWSTWSEDVKETRCLVEVYMTRLDPNRADDDSDPLNSVVGLSPQESHFSARFITASDPSSPVEGSPRYAPRPIFPHASTFPLTCCLVFISLISTTPFAAHRMGSEFVTV